MNPLHLLWIIHLSAGFGMLLTAIIAVGGNYERELEKDDFDNFIDSVDFPL